MKLLIPLLAAASYLTAQPSPEPKANPSPHPNPSPKISADFDFDFKFEPIIAQAIERAFEFKADFPLLAQEAIDKNEIAQRAKEDARRAVEEARRNMERDFRNDRRDGYQDGTRALDKREYDQAVASFDRVIAARSPRSEGAYYWKAYALNRLGRRDEANAVLAELAKQFPQSRWLNDARALQAEMRQATGQAASPESFADEDLKLYAINALSNFEPERAVPLLEKLIGDQKASPRLKERALFVLAQSRSDQAQRIVSQYARNGSNPDLQLHAVEYLGTFRSKESQQSLAEIYSSVSDAGIKRAVLRGYMQSRDTEHLTAVARTEQNAELRREAIDFLGSLQSPNELAQLYASESSFEWKERILRAMSNSHNSAKLLEVARTDKDARLRQAAIRSFGGRKEVSPEDIMALYTTEPEPAVRKELLNSLYHRQAVKQIVEVLRKEQDPDLRRRGVQWLANSKSKEATDFLAEILSK
jgi:hypothetical protein